MEYRKGKKYGTWYVYNESGKLSEKNSF